MSSRNRSFIWNNFTKISAEKAKCDLCSTTLSIKGGSTTNLIRHTKTKHPTVINIDDMRNRVRSAEAPVSQSTQLGPSAVQSTSTHNPSSTIVSTEPGPSTSGCSNDRNNNSNLTNSGKSTSVMQQRITCFTNRPLPVKKSKEIDQQLLKLLASEYLPFNLVENEEFKKFVYMLQPSYNLPTRKTLSNSILTNVYNQLSEIVKTELKTATAVCITTDGWTSMINNSYLALTAHFINNNCEMRSLLVDCFEFNQSHTAEHLAEQSKRVLLEWSIYDKVVVLVTDNAANMTAAVKMGGWKHLPCFAHSLNLIVQAGLKEINETHKKVKGIAEFFKRSPQAAFKLRSVQTQMGYSELNVKQDMPVRWNSTYEMFERMLKMKEPLISTLAIVNFDKQHLSFHDWNIIEYSCKILKTFKEVTLDVSAEKYVTISKIPYLSRALLRHCTTVQNEIDIPPEISAMLVKMIEQLSRRFSQIEDNLVIAEATILDPRFKKYGFSNQQAFEKAKSALTRKATSIVMEAEVDETQSMEVEQPNDEGAVSIWNDYDNTTANFFNNDNATAAAIIEINSYLQEPIIKRNCNPLVWWQERKNTYPRLFQIMKKKLCVTATSVPCERAFSKAGLIVTEKRTRLSANKVQKLLFINANHKNFKIE